eukprot:757623-Hanusia_phi.AAC.3
MEVVVRTTNSVHEWMMCERMKQEQRKGVGQGLILILPLYKANDVKDILTMFAESLFASKGNSVLVLTSCCNPFTYDFSQICAFAVNTSRPARESRPHVRGVAGILKRLTFWWVSLSTDRVWWRKKRRSQQGER